jgi:hypothetical protein
VNKQKSGFSALPKETRKFILDINALRFRATQMHLFKTSMALNEAERVVGWELAGEPNQKRSP